MKEQLMERKPIRERVAELFKEEKSVDEILEILQKEGFKTKTNKPYHRNYIYTLRKEMMNLPGKTKTKIKPSMVTIPIEMPRSKGVVIVFAEPEEVTSILQSWARR